MRNATRVRFIVFLTAILAVPTIASQAGPRIEDAPAASTAQGSRRAADPAVIADWDAIAVRTIIVEGLKPPPVAQLYLGFVSAAVYSAVVAIEGRFEPIGGPRRGRSHASSEAAAATAAYGVLSYYFPASTDLLTADYEAALAGIRDGARETRGIRVGRAAANAVIRQREGDGRDDPAVVLDVPLAPGVWRPTPTAFAPMTAPWLGFVDPLLLDSATQFPLPGPDALASPEYAQDFAEVMELGELGSTSRTAEQTETALFWSDNLVVQYQAGFRDLATQHNLDIVESARMFAVLNVTGADALIACWRAKYDYAFWRPITAIQTTVDPTWMSLILTPPYPDYTSGHACLTGSTANGLTELFGPQFGDFVVTSAVTGTTRHYFDEATLDQETVDARVWLGIHFRTAMRDGNQLGHRVSDWILEHYFQPVH